MIIPIRLYRLKRILLDQWSFFVSLLVFSLLFLVVLIFYAKTNSQRKDVELMTAEVQLLKNRYDTLKYNKTLTEDQIKEYNKLLVSLIPETEDYFSIIYALEQISASSHFTITDYTIDVGKTNRERITITAEGTGDANAFLTFLEDYPFSGGRLATSDKIQYGGDNAGNTRITLNFYNKRFTFNESVQVPQLSKTELAKLDSIRQKIKFQFSSAGFQTVDTNYNAKSNPFSEDQNPGISPSTIPEATTTPQESQQ